MGECAGGCFLPRYRDPVAETRLLSRKYVLVLLSFALSGLTDFPSYILSQPLKRIEM